MGSRLLRELDQKPRFFIGHLPYLCDHYVRDCHYSVALAPHVPPSSPRVGEEGGKGEGKERQGVLRSTGPETVKTLCHRVAETHALPATISLTIMAMS